MNGLSPSEAAFVEALIETGEPSAAAAISGAQPSLAHDPRIQAALVDQIQVRGAVDAVYARKTLYDLAKSADQDSVRLRAATTLWERGLGKVPETVNVNVRDQSVSREALYAEIRLLIEELGLPPTIEGQAEQVREADAPRIDHEQQAGVAQQVEPPEPTPDVGREVAGSSPAAGTGYIPEIPPKWR